MRTLLILSFTIFLSSTSSAKMVFQKQVKDQRFIVLANNDGTGQKIISDPKVDTYHPEISGSGRFVSYSRGTIKPGTKVSVELIVKDLKNNVTEVWTPRGNQYIHAEFSGNDNFLVFSGINKTNLNQNIMIVDLIKERKKGPSSKKVINGIETHFYKPQLETIESTFDCYAPAVSSDGSFIVYHRTLVKDDKSAPKQLVMYNRQTQEKNEITAIDKHAMFPTISANDRYVAYTSKDDGQWDIYLFDLWKNKKTKVTDDSNIEFTPVFSSDDTLYYTRFATDSLSNALIDVYSIPKEQVFDPSVKAIPQAFLDDAHSAEYVVSFSNPYDISMEKATELLSPERSSFGSVFYNNKIYVAGGHTGPEHTYPKESFLDVLEVYDIKTKKWAQLAPMKLAKHGFQMVAHNNFLYVFGGFTFSEDHLPKWKSVNTVERYDITKNEWEVLSQRLPNNRSSNALGKVGDKVYLLGGWDSTPKFANDKEGKFLSAIDVFDLNTEVTSTISMTLPQPLRRAFTAVVVKGEIHLLGGIGEGASHFDWIDNVTVFNPNKNVWRELPPLPFATFAPGAGEINGDIFLMGGMVLKDKATFDLDYVDDIYRFDQKSQSWSHSGAYLLRNKGFPQVVPMPGDNLGVLGGHTYELTPNGYVDHPVRGFEVLSL